MKIYGLLLLVLVFFSACSMQEKNYVVGYLNPSKERIRFEEEGNYMIEELDKAGIECIVSYAQDNHALQMQQGFELLEDGVDVLVIPAINGYTIRPLVEQAKEEGVIVVAYNMLIMDTPYDLFVTGNNQELAKDICKFVLDKKPNGNFVVLGGDKFDHNGFELKNSIDSILKPLVEAEKIEIVYNTFVERWSREHAAYEFNQVFKSYNRGIDAVISCNDAMGLGVIDVLAQNEALYDVVVTGQDATLEAVRSIYRGELGITFYHPGKELGQKAAELIIAMLKENKSGEELSDGEVFNGSFNVPVSRVKSIPVTKDNLDVLVEKGVYTWEEIKN